MKWRYLFIILFLNVVFITTYSYSYKLFDEKFEYFNKNKSKFEDNKDLYNTLSQIESIINCSNNNDYIITKKENNLTVYVNSASGSKLEEDDEDVDLMQLDGLYIYKTYRFYLQDKLQKELFLIDANFIYELSGDQSYKNLNDPSLVLMDYSKKYITEIWYHSKGKIKYQITDYSDYKSLKVRKFTKIKY